jgi:hypothetical protein
MNDNETKLRDIHEYVKKLDALEPVFQFEQPKREDSYSVNEALASAFADPAFRSHIKNVVNKQIYHAAVNSNTEREAWMNAGRITIMKELFRDMERAYNIIMTPKKDEK